MTSAKHNQTRVSSDRAGSMIYEDSLSKGKDHDALVRATFLASKTHASPSRPSPSRMSR